MDEFLDYGDVPEEIIAEAQKLGEDFAKIIGADVELVDIVGPIDEEEVDMWLEGLSVTDLSRLMVMYKMRNALDDGNHINLRVGGQARVRMVETVLEYGQVETLAVREPNTFVSMIFPLPDRTMIGYGFAKCMYTDEFDVEEGVRIATKRAARHIVDSLIDGASGSYETDDEAGSEALINAIALISLVAGPCCFELDAGPTELTFS